MITAAQAPVTAREVNEHSMRMSVDLSAPGRAREAVTVRARPMTVPDYEREPLGPTTPGHRPTIPAIASPVVVQHPDRDVRASKAGPIIRAISAGSAA